MDKAKEEILKEKNGQAGPDGNPFVRNRRIEMRVSPQEHAAVCAAAIANGFASVAQYVREQAMQSRNVDSPISRRKALLACQYELNRIGNNVNQIARQLNQGYQSLQRYGKHCVVNHSKEFVHKKTRNHINGIEGFWSYAKHILYNYRGVSRYHFPMYLKEIEYRYNHCNDNIFKMILKLFFGYVSP